MAEVDRRGFMRLLRRKDADEAQGAQEAGARGEPAPLDPETQGLADLTESILGDLRSDGEELLAEGALFTPAFDRAYMRVTDRHIVFSLATGFSGHSKTDEVRDFETFPPTDFGGRGPNVYATLRAHHPADLPHITRSFTFRFPEDSPLIGAIRTACDLPEPEPEPEGETAGETAGEADTETPS